MKLIDFPELKWLALSVIIVTMLLKVWLSIHDTVGLILIGLGLAIFLYAIFLDHRMVDTPRVLWDNEREFIATLRKWRVEVSAARILGSVPLGIDLSHSAKKVLQAMYTRFEIEPGGTLVFFINRPLGNETTRVGMLVKRSCFRLPSVASRIENLARMLLADVMMMESAMRAAYPHLPVERAREQDILMVCNGGVETIA